MLTNREIDVIEAALAGVNSTNSEGMQEVNIIRGKFADMRQANNDAAKNAAKEVPANGGTDAQPTQTV